MKLKPRVRDINTVDEKFRDLYTQRGEEWVFTGCEGHSVDNVETLTQSLTAARKFGNEQKAVAQKWTKAFPDAEPEKVQEQLDRTEEYRLASEGKLDASEIEKRVEARLATATAPLQRKVESLTTERDQEREKVQGLENEKRGTLIGNELLGAALEGGGDPEACKPGGGFMKICGDYFELGGVDGKTVVTKEGCGFRQGLTPSEVMPELKSRHHYLFGTSEGSGARSGTGGGGGGGGNPWAKDTFSRTEQMRIAKLEPERAASLKKEAGYEGSGLN